VCERERERESEGVNVCAKDAKEENLYIGMWKRVNCLFLHCNSRKSTYLRHFKFHDFFAEKNANKL